MIPCERAIEMCDHNGICYISDIFWGKLVSTPPNLYINTTAALCAALYRVTVFRGRKLGHFSAM